VVMWEALKLTILVHEPYETRRKKISAPSATSLDWADMKLCVSMVSEKHLARIFFGRGSHGSGANHGRNGGIRSVAFI